MPPWISTWCSIQSCIASNAGGLRRCDASSRVSVIRERLTDVAPTDFRFPSPLLARRGRQRP
jgi:hypothetical protein